MLYFVLLTNTTPFHNNRHDINSHKFLVMSELPFRVEYARSGKSTCKNCHTRISVDTLRIARLFKSALFDGYQTNWFHDVCFFVVHRPQSVGDIGGFESIRTVDQEFIAREIGTSTGV